MTDIVDNKVLNELGIVFKTVKFKNFMSFGNIFTEVDLEGSGTTLLMGENLDDGGSSGAGKSTLINAISYCLYDKIPSSVTKDKLINRTNDKKSTQMEVDLTFTKGADVYEVRRWRGGSTGVQLLLNDQDVTPASVSRGEDSFNNRVEEILGFSYNLFSQIILFNGNSRPFLDLSVGAQRELIEELFRITILSRKANALKKKISDLDKTIDMQKVLIGQQQKQNENHARRVQEAEERVMKWNQTHKLDLLKISESIHLLSNVDFDSEEALFREVSSLTKSIADLQSKIREETSIYDSALKTLETKLWSHNKDRFPTGTPPAVIANKERNEILTKILKIDKELDHLSDAKCPYCLQQFADANAKITDLTQHRGVLEEDERLKQIECDQLLAEAQAEADRKRVIIEQIEEEIKAFKLTKTQSIHSIPLSELQDTLKEYQSALSYRDLSSLLKAKNEQSTLAQRFERMNVETNPHDEALQALIAEGEVEIDVEALEALIHVQEHQQFLLKLLTDKNSFIRKNIISKTIPFLNKRIAYYTESVNLPHIVLFQPDMTCEITQIGRDLDHGNLSNGEKKKLNLSLCLAFRDVLTYLHSKVNVLFTDEVDGGSISGPDVDSLITMLKSKAWDDDISIFIISHRPEFDGRCDNNLVIRKEGGFSTLLLQPDE